MNRAFKVIQGHPYCCRQESRKVCCRNVLLMPTLFLKLTKIWNGKTANSSISTKSNHFISGIVAHSRQTDRYT